MKTIKELEGKNYMACSACMSVLADGLSWANAHTDKIVKSCAEADNVVVLSCQVTDLAVLNDIKTIERYHASFPEKNYFISGCLAKRQDVPLPGFVERLETPRENYQFINDRTLVNFEKPFWVPKFEEKDSTKADGHLFRDMYPLRISKGCPNRCTYCTINMTRGEFEKLETARLEKEFLAFDNVLLVADSPTVEQVRQWYGLALKHNKPFSIRNVEPSVTVACKHELYDLADKKLLVNYHSPIQSSNPAVIRDMGRSVPAMIETMIIAEKLKEKGVYIATNIIIDYKDFKQDFTNVYKLYDYVSWNPLWDGKWDRTKAEERFQKYIASGTIPIEVKNAMINAGKLEGKLDAKFMDAIYPRMIHGAYSESELLEKLAEIEHVQWQDWSENLWKELSSIRKGLYENDVAGAIKTLDARFQRWSKNWIPYDRLSDDVQEYDRIYARKVIDILKSSPINQSEDRGHR